LPDSGITVKYLKASFFSSVIILSVTTVLLSLNLDGLFLDPTHSLHVLLFSAILPGALGVSWILIWIPFCVMKFKSETEHPYHTKSIIIFYVIPYFIFLVLVNFFKMQNVTGLDLEPILFFPLIFPQLFALYRYFSWIPPSVPERPEKPKLVTLSSDFCMFYIFLPGMKYCYFLLIPVIRRQRCKNHKIHS
jgi:hypothetical protein